MGGIDLTSPKEYGKSYSSAANRNSTLSCTFQCSKEITVGNTFLTQSSSHISKSLHAGSPDENNVESFLLTSLLP